jgi:hypothetical protein
MIRSRQSGKGRLTSNCFGEQVPAHRPVPTPTPARTRKEQQ